MNLIKIRKNGTFYAVYGEDTYILYFLFDYKIKNDKVGFPKSALNKVINVLEENKINYEVIGEDLKNSFKNLNNYLKYVKSGKEKYNKAIYYENIKDKIKKVSPQKLDKILSTIETILDE